jgi:D-serine deaminase-like pyridoxal phosphate-dependent protein
MNEALIGAPDGRQRLLTPALVLDAAAFARNLAAMAAIAAARGVALRPHAKTHKSVAIARRQIEAGAIGVSCTILREAEAMVAGGILGVLITSPVVTPASIERLIALARRAGPDGLMVVVDDPANAKALSDAAAGLDHPLGVLVDFSAGYSRTGTATEADAVSLAKIMNALPHLALRGLQAYAGNIQHIVERPSREDRAAWLRAAVARIVAAADAEGIALPIVTGAGTGTHDIDAAPFTEIQPGSYLFGDAQYGPVLANGVAASPFETALFLQAAVVSTRAEAYVTLDGGVKSLATDGPLPLVARGAAADCTYAFFGDEHGKLFCPSARPALGAKVELVTPHCDPTVNLHDALHVVEGETLVAIWPIDARGH